jgi:hypothetical protein
MPFSRLVIALFIMLRSSSMSVRRKFVLLGGFPVCAVHDYLLLSNPNPPSPGCTTRAIRLVGDVWNAGLIAILKSR